MPGESKRTQSRRELLAAGAGGLVGLAAASLVRPTGTATAATGDPVLLGTSNTADAETSIAASADPGVTVNGLTVTAAELGWAVAGGTPRGAGVLGVSGTTDVAPDAESDIGVVGRADHAEAVAGVAGDSSTGAGVIGTSAGIGVAGAGATLGALATSFDTTGTGILASTGFPVPTPRPGTALHAVRPLADGGYAAFIDGRLKLRLSGRTSILAGKSSKKVTVSGVASTMMVFALLQSNEPGTWIRAAVPSSNAVTIYLNKSLATNATVAWMVLG